MRAFASLPWHDLGDAPWARPSLASTATLPARCEIAVVGAGVTGLSCALGLAAQGPHVVVLDRRFGSGATCRSGGIIVGDTLVGPAPGFEHCEHDLRRWIVEGRVACDLDWTGCAELDRSDALPASPIDWHDAGRVRVSHMVEGGILNPAALLSALAARALQHGVTLVDGAELQSCERAGSAVSVVTSAGPLTADRVVLTVDATARASQFDPWPNRLFTVVLQTAPVSDALAGAIGWRDRWPFYTNDLPLLWGRPMGDGSLMAGRELLAADLSGDALRDAIAVARTRLTSRIRALHPALASLAVRRVWAGPIARDNAGVPGVQSDPDIPGVWWAGGYGGHGLAQAFRLGARAAAVVLGGR